MKNLKRYAILYMIAAVLIASVVMFFIVYRPTVGAGASDSNAFGSNFGAFYWGFGTMCFTLINAILFYMINQNIQRKSFYDVYRQALGKVIDASLDLLYTTKPNNDNIQVVLNKQLKSSMIHMNGILGGIKESNMFSHKVEKYAMDLFDKGTTLLTTEASFDDFTNFIGDLSGFQVCLLNNKVSAK